MISQSSRLSKSSIYIVLKGQLYLILELKNREYYMTHDVRPPFTYATLIRQVSNLDEKLSNDY